MLGADKKITIEDGSTDRPFIRTISAHNYFEGTDVATISKINGTVSTTYSTSETAYYDFPLHADIFGADVVLDEISICYYLDDPGASKNRINGIWLVKVDETSVSNVVSHGVLLRPVLLAIRNGTIYLLRITQWLIMDHIILSSKWKRIALS